MKRFISLFLLLPALGFAGDFSETPVKQANMVKRTFTFKAEACQTNLELTLSTEKDGTTTSGSCHVNFTKANPDDTLIAPHFRNIPITDGSVYVATTMTGYYVLYHAKGSKSQADALKDIDSAFSQVSSLTSVVWVIEE